MSLGNLILWGYFVGFVFPLLFVPHIEGDSNNTPWNGESCSVVLWDRKDLLGKFTYWGTLSVLLLQSMNWKKKTPHRVPQGSPITLCKHRIPGVQTVGSKYLWRFFNSKLRRLCELIKDLSPFFLMARDGICIWWCPCHHQFGFLHPAIKILWKIALKANSPSLFFCCCLDSESSHTRSWADPANQNNSLI